MRMVRMRADGAEHVLIRFRYGADLREFRHMGRDGNHPRDPVAMRARDDLRLFRREIGKVEVAVGVDEHVAHNRIGARKTRQPFVSFVPLWFNFFHHQGTKNTKSSHAAGRDAPGVAT